jgi:uncharacterized protein
MPTPLLSALFVYPIKSLAGVALAESLVFSGGLLNDRRFMLVETDGRFITQRSDPSLARLRIAVEAETLVLTRPDDRSFLTVPIGSAQGPEMVTQVFGRTVTARRVNDDVDAWFSDHLGRSVHLLRVPDDVSLAFQDGYPVLLLGEASLSALNARIDVALPMNRFRPNLVIRDSEPHAEDGWAKICVGDAGFVGNKLCSRCVITTTDQETGQRDREPLATFAKYRRFEKSVYFGINMTPEASGRIAVGDPVTVSERFETGRAPL